MQVSKHREGINISVTKAGDTVLVLSSIELVLVHTSLLLGLERVRHKLTMPEIECIRSMVEKLA